MVRLSCHLAAVAKLNLVTFLAEVGRSSVSMQPCFRFAGISGAFWYASGATVQILLFGIMAIEIKRKAPRAHTVLEVTHHHAR